MRYKRFLIPLGGADNAVGRCLVEKMQGTAARITVTAKNLGRRPLGLWLFDAENAYRYPKTLYTDRSGSLVLRCDVKDMQLGDIRCACLTDDMQQPALSGFCGEKIDWRAILLHGSKPEQSRTDEETQDFKTEVRGLVREFDRQLRPSAAQQKQPFETLQWNCIDQKQLANNKRLWKYTKNPFVAGHCSDDKPLMLAESEKFWFLGVPCSSSDKFSGCSQGFRIFRNSEGKEYCILKCEK